MRPSRFDIAALCVLVATAGIVGWPIWTGGYLTYMDNPVHVAELESLAIGEQWSDIGFCGFPLAFLHSPLWYRGLSLLVHLGIAAGPLFGLFLFFASLSPALAVYLVGRRALPPLAALLPAWLLFVQRTSIVGYGSVFAGMATFYIGVGLLVLLIEFLARAERSWRETLVVALMLALVALTHLFALVAAALMLLLHTLRLLLRRPRHWARTLSRDAVACGIAGLCSSLYWYPTIRNLSVSYINAQNLDPIRLLKRLLFPTDLLQGVQTDLFLLDALPLMALVALGLLGMRRLRRWPSATSLYGALLAGGLAVLLFVVLPITNSAWMGPNSWRYLPVLRCALALASLPLLRGLCRGSFVDRPRSLAIFGGIALISSFALGAPLRSQVGQPRGAAWEELQELWKHLRTQPGLPGRVFVQSTFMTAPRDHPFERSHVPVLSAHETGIHQHGVYYGIVPYRTLFITRGEFGRVLDLWIMEDFDHEELWRRLKITNTTRLVLADPQAAEILAGAGFGEISARFGRYSVLDLAVGNHGWIGGDHGTIRLRRWDPGHVVFDIEADRYPVVLLVKQAFDPGWESPPGTQMSESSDSLIQLTIEREPEGEIELRWRPYRAQNWMAASGCLVLLLGLLAVNRRRGA